jgi:hypothetical protein
MRTLWLTGLPCRLGRSMFPVKLPCSSMLGGGIVEAEATRIRHMKMRGPKMSLRDSKCNTRMNICIE